MRTKITCCKDCTRRHGNCHASCADYIKESAELDEGREAERKRMHDHTMLMECEMDRVKRIEKMRA